jgi:RimJ/RimL family protein N-acetyltransferase
MIDPPAVFETSRLRLRPPVLEDARAIFEEYATDPEVTRYLTWVPHETAETVAEFLEFLLSRAGSGEACSWVLTSRSADRAIGMLDARVLGHEVDIGYVLGRRHWGQGYMSEAVAELTEWMVSQPDIFRVWAVCDVETIASARVLEKAGFEREGILRRWISHPNRSSEPRDCLMYGRARGAASPAMVK